MIACEDASPLAGLAADDIEILECPQGMKLGAKRNWMVQRAAPGVILHWDDDDWSHAERMSEMVNALQFVPVSGYYSILFAAPDGTIRLYDYHSPRHALGTSLAYRREWWESHPFVPHAHVQEDHTFATEAARMHAIRTFPGHHRMVARDHAGNTSSRNYGSPGYTIWRDELPEGYAA